jgi:hypothetical protein
MTTANTHVADALASPASDAHSPVPNPPPASSPLRPSRRIPNTEAVDGIVNVIRERLMRQDMFRRVNGCAIGIDLSYALKVRYYSLGEQGLDVTGEIAIGETGAAAIKQGAKKEVAEVAGHMVAGKVPLKASGATVADKLDAKVEAAG